MDFVQWVNTVGLALAFMGFWLNIKKDNSSSTLIAVIISLGITVTTSGRIYGWW